LESLNGYTGIDIKSGDLTLFAYYPIDSWNYDSESGSSLTISGGTINATGGYTGIYSGDHLTISGGTIHTSGNNGYGIYAHTDLTITGGDITANGIPDGIYARSGAITIEGGTVNATGTGHGIYAQYGAITIEGGSVTAEGDNYGLYAYSGAITISGGTVDAAGGNSFGIYAYDTLTISGGDVTASSDHYFGIYAYHTLTVTGGSVTATGKEDGIVAEDIELGPRVTVRTGGTVRVASLYYSDGYIKTVVENGQTKYFYNSTELEVGDCPAVFSDTEDLHISTFASGDDIYYDSWFSTFFNASPGGRARHQLCK